MLRTIRAVTTTGHSRSAAHTHISSIRILLLLTLLSYDPVLSKEMKAKNAVDDYKKSLQRQIELYLWLQSADGPFAGGCTNSKNGKYEKYASSDPTFYDMVYVEHPVYADPGSNHWIGNQVWSTQRLAELYYYVKTNGDLSKGTTYGGLSLEEALEALLSRWIDWFIENTEFDYVDKDGNEMAYAIPSNLDWSGKPASWNEKYNPDANKGLTCRSLVTARAISDAYPHSVTHLSGSLLLIRFLLLLLRQTTIQSLLLRVSVLLTSS